jgi:hypothetical protein
MFPADNMVDLVREASICFVNQTVLATMIGSASYFDTDLRTDLTGHEK